jgi:hypothetical protein
VVIKIKTSLMPDLVLALGRASTSHPPGEWDDFDAYDGEREVGRIYRINAATRSR